MSATNTAIVKRSFKFIEIPLNKFKNEAIPHHQEVFLKHKSNIHKLTNVADYQQLDREVRDKLRIVRQLKDLMYELDTLRTQVEDFDLDRFDSITLSMRKIILKLISDYSNLELDTRKRIEEYNNDENVQDTSQIQIQDFEVLTLQDTENQCRRIEGLNSDIQDVHNIFLDLNRMVGTQKEQVEIVELNTEVADNNIKGGLFYLIKAAKLKKASYPVAGAFIGTLVGGPIGSVAGLKIGGIAAIGCGLAGYVGGKFFRKVNDEEILKTQVELESTNCVTSINQEGLDINTANDKKDI